MTSGTNTTPAALTDSSVSFFNISASRWMATSVPRGLNLSGSVPSGAGSDWEMQMSTRVPTCPLV